MDRAAREESPRQSPRAVEGVSTLARRGRLWVGVDQALSSATNFGCSALIAGLLTADDFGAFSVAFALYVVALGVVRAWTSDVLLVTSRPHQLEDHQRLVSSTISASLGISLLAGVVLVVVSTALDGPTRVAVACLGVCIPFMLVQDTGRYGLITMDRAGRACTSDASWLIISTAAIMTLRLTNTDSVTLATLAWGLGAVPGAVWGARQIGGRITKPGALTWLRQATPLSSRILPEFAISMLSGVVMLIVVASAFADVSDGGAIRGAQVLMGPVTVVFTATVLYVQPAMVRRLGRDRGVRKLAAQQSLFNGTAALCWMGLVQLTPDRIGVRVFGATWVGAKEMLTYVGIAVIGAGLYTGATNEMRARHLVGPALRARLFAGLLVVTLTVGGGLLADLLGAMRGFALASLLTAIIPWMVLPRAVRQDPSHREDKRSVDN